MEPCIVTPNSGAGSRQTGITTECTSFMIQSSPYLALGRDEVEGNNVQQRSVAEIDSGTEHVLVSASEWAALC